MRSKRSTKGMKKCAQNNGFARWIIMQWWMILGVIHQVSDRSTIGREDMYINSSKQYVKQKQHISCSIVPLRAMLTHPWSLQHLVNKHELTSCVQRMAASRLARHCSLAQIPKAGSSFTCLAVKQYWARYLKLAKNILWNTSVPIPRMHLFWVVGTYLPRPRRPGRDLCRGCSH